MVCFLFPTTAYVKQLNRFTHTTVMRDECARCMFSTAVENQHSSVPLLSTSFLKAVHVSSDCLIDRSLVQSDIQDGGSFGIEEFLMFAEINTAVCKLKKKKNLNCFKTLG